MARTDTLEQDSMARRLRNRRGQLRLTQQEVADALGINRITYSHYETGRSAIVATDLPRLASILQTSVGYFFGLTDEKEVTKIQAAQAARAFLAAYPLAVQTLALEEIIPKLVRGRTGEEQNPEVETAGELERIRFGSWLVQYAIQLMPQVMPSGEK